jgi:hypothetical protein
VSKDRDLAAERGGEGAVRGELKKTLVVDHKDELAQQEDLLFFKR